MTSKQVNELHQLSRYFSEGEATPAHIKKLSELIVLINSHSDDEDYSLSDHTAPSTKKMSQTSSF